MNASEADNQAVSTAFIGLGSNLGNPVAQLEAAVNALAQLPGVALRDVSGLYASPPMGPQDQPDYINAVACIATTLTPVGLLSGLKALERASGRLVTRHWGERILDLDILAYAECVLATPELTIPHPGISQRRFVVEPWLEIAPDARLPDGTKLAELATGLTDHPLRFVKQLDLSDLSGETHKSDHEIVKADRSSGGLL